MAGKKTSILGLRGRWGKKTSILKEKHLQGNTSIISTPSVSEKQE